MYLKKYLMMMAALLCVLPLSAINPQNSKMKELNVKKVSVANIPVESVPALMDEEKVAFQPVNTVNWAVFPYTPDVEFRIAHTEDAILLHFKVREASVRAVAGHDNGPVWEDACVEFFSVPAGDGVSTIWSVIVPERCLSVRVPDVETASMPRKRCSI